jgi:hypothetical protein
MMTGGRDNGSALIGFLTGLGRARRKFAITLGAFAPRPFLSTLGGARGGGFQPPWASGRAFGLIERREAAPAVAPRSIASASAPVAFAQAAATRGPTDFRSAASPSPSRSAGAPPSETQQDRAARPGSAPSVQTGAAAGPPSVGRDAALSAERDSASAPQPDARAVGPGAAPSPLSMVALRRGALAGLAPLLAFLPRARHAGDGRIAGSALSGFARITPASLSALHVVASARTLPVSRHIDRFFPREDQTMAALAGQRDAFATAPAAESVPPSAAAKRAPFASPIADAAASPAKPPVRSARDPIFPETLVQHLPARAAAFPPAASAATLDNETSPLKNPSAGRDPLRQMAGIADRLREDVAAELREVKASFARAEKAAPNPPAQRAPAVTDDFARRLLARMRELMREERFRSGDLR